MFKICAHGKRFPSTIIIYKLCAHGKRFPNPKFTKYDIRVIMSNHGQNTKTDNFVIMYNCAFTENVFQIPKMKITDASVTS